MRKKSLLAVAVSAAALTGLGASAALAGEVKGPPGQINNQNFTPVHDHVAASVCSFNGLNDYFQGQMIYPTQNYGTNKRLGLDPAEFGFPGTDCNPTR